MAISLIIVDDHDIIHSGIKSILKEDLNYKVAAEAKTAEEALTKVEKLKPEILLLDISMPKKSGLDIIEQIHRISPKTKILIITVHKANAYLMNALSAGVNGYIYKENAAEELLPALRKIAAGGTYLTSSVSSYLVDKAIKKTGKKESEETLLTSREEDILRLVADGKSAKEIAKLAFISRRTVENYKNTLLKKLGLHKTSDLIKYAIKHKIVDIDEY